jgi:hypothetical protein
MAFIGAGTATATVLCSTTSDPCPAGQDYTVGTVLDFSIPAGASAHLEDTSGNTLDTCTTSTVKGTVSNTGGSAATVSGAVSELTWGGPCTFTTATTTLGELEIHKIAGTSNGTLTAKTEFEVTVFNSLLGDCFYRAAAGTDLGILTEGNPAVFHASAKVTRTNTPGCLAPTSAVWTATYNQTAPATTLSVSSS